MSTKTSFLFLILLLTILTPSTVLAAKKICTRSHRISADSCSQDFKDMCIFFSDSTCDSTICQRLTSNECTACLDPTVLYFIDQPCPGDKVYCDTNRRPTECPAGGSSVCGFTQQGCTDESCRKTLPNGCQACQDPTVLYYKKEECPVPEEKVQCSTFDLASADCTDNIAEPICAYFNETCDKEICSATVYSPCAACSSLSILYYTKGACEPEADQRTYCIPGNRPAQCATTSGPVCGITSGTCEGGMCGKTYDDGCNACQDELVGYHTPGSCTILAKEANLLPQLTDIDRIFQQESCTGCDSEEELSGEPSADENLDGGDEK